MRKAVIDLGTNTFNLLIGEINDNRLDVIWVEKEPVLLGMGGINEGKIAADAYVRAMSTLMRFNAKCKLYQVAHTIGFGTSALREASNGMQFIAEAKERFGLDIAIISGDEEANLIYRGVKWLYDFSVPAIIMDIGGGSTEFIVASSEGVKNSASFNIGVSRIYQILGKVEEYTKQNFETIHTYIEQGTGNFFSEEHTNVLIGASGSFETLYEMIYEKKFISPEKLVSLPIEELLKQIEWVLDSTYEDRLNNPWIIPMRKQMIPIAVLKIKWVIEKLNIKEVWLSPYSLKEGALNQPDKDTTSN